MCSPDLQRRNSVLSPSTTFVRLSTLETLDSLSTFNILSIYLTSWIFTTSTTFTNQVIGFINDFNKIGYLPTRQSLKHVCLFKSEVIIKT